MTKRQFKKRWTAKFGSPRFPWAILWDKYQRVFIFSNPLWFWEV